MVKHQQIRAENQKRAQCERTCQNMEGADVIHDCRADHHQRADYECAVHVGQSQPQVGLQTLAGLLLKLPHFKILAPERVHHADRAQAFLRLSENGALLFLNGGRLAANPMGKKIDGAHNQWNNPKRDERKLPVQSQHDDESSDQRDDRPEDVGESLIVDCLNRLRIVRHAETGIARAPRVVVFQRERLQIRVQVGAQLE